MWDVLLIDARVLVPTVQAFGPGVHGGGGNGGNETSGLILLTAIFSDTLGSAPYRHWLVMCWSWLMFSTTRNILV